jgi:hypothetical protein
MRSHRLASISVRGKKIASSIAEHRPGIHATISVVIAGLTAVGGRDPVQIELAVNGWEQPCSFT